MNFTVDKNILLNGINTVTKALPQKSTVAVIEGILFQAENNTVKLCCTDLSMTIESTFEARIENGGSVVLNGKLISEIVRKMPPGDININGDEINGVVISGMGSKISIMGLKADDFPQLPHFTKAKGYKLPQGLLKQMINQT
ncbi:MAG: DNA polymerase III subunit beta, partial [Firmicutes bacterium]|nr:DNA polymerase III subunit beta [Bacillota bacterium]